MDPLGYKRALVGRRESPGRTQFNAQLNRHGSVNITVRPMDPNGISVYTAINFQPWKRASCWLILNIRSPPWLAVFVGVAEKNTRKLFKKHKKNTPRCSMYGLLYIYPQTTQMLVNRPYIEHLGRCKYKKTTETRPG